MQPCHLSKLIPIDVSQGEAFAANFSPPRRDEAPGSFGKTGPVRSSACEAPHFKRLQILDG